MSKNEKLCLEFSRQIPAPFDAVSRKQSVASKYGTTSSTMCASIVKAILMACEIKAGNTRGGVGTCSNGGKTLHVCEYKSVIADEFHLVVYNPDKGTFMASVYDTLTGSVEMYKCGPANRDGTALLLCMLTKFMEDQEFTDKFEELYDHYLNGWPDINAAGEAMCIISDNVYRRIKDANLSCYTPVELDAVGNLARVNTQALRQGTYEPDGVLIGGFEIFATKTAAAGATGAKKGNDIDHKDFIGKYPLSKRVLTAKEQTVVPNIPEHIIITKEAQRICKLAHGSTGERAPMRNFLLRGGAGSGKTWTAKQVGAGLGLPEVTLTCHPDMSMDELIGQMLPKTSSSGCENELSVLNDMGGITPSNVEKLLNLPSYDDMEFDPAGAYEKLTGTKKDDATPQECYALHLSLVTDKIAQLYSCSEEKNYVEYEFVEGVLLQAIKYGWVCEIQEPTVISRPGVLAGLNSILEQDGGITLPDGRVIKRHPDAVVILTTNISYEGCRGLNQSVIDRMSEIYDVETPKLSLMVERAMAVTGETDEPLVSRMAQVVCDTAQYCKENCITSGITGMRVLIDWITSNKILKNPYEAAMNTLISKASDDEEERVAITTTCLDPMITPTGPVSFV